MLSPVLGDSRRKHFVKLIDFGLARRRENEVPDRLFGTPEYIPPEAARREPVTPSSDVYSLGIMFFELITGGVPWVGPVREVVLKQITELPPSLSDRMGKRVDPAIEKLIRTALAKSPNDRHRDMSAFLYELRTVMDMMGYPKPRSARRASAVNSGPSWSAQALVARPQAPGGPVPEAAHRDNLGAQFVQATFDTFRLPIATIAADGTIVAANTAFSKFLVGMLVSLVGTNIHQTALAGGVGQHKRGSGHGLRWRSGRPRHRDGCPGVDRAGCAAGCGSNRSCRGMHPFRSIRWAWRPSITGQ